MEPINPLWQKPASLILYERIQSINCDYIGRIYEAIGNKDRADLDMRRRELILESITEAFKHLQDIIDSQQSLITYMTHTQIRDIRNHYTVSLGEQPDTPIDPLQGTASTDPYAYDLKKQSEDL